MEKTRKEIFYKRSLAIVVSKQIERRCQVNYFLWRIKDKYARDLLVKFYGILGNKNVTSKIEALRLAQLQMAGLPDLLGKDKDKQSPEWLSDNSLSSAFPGIFAVY
jgi:hypothetical protein